MRRAMDQHHFVGRGAELAQLGAARRQAGAGEPSVVFVAAEAGVGKTRLLGEFVAGIDGRVLWGGCLPLGERGLPFAPIVEVLRSLAEDANSGGIPPPLAPLLSGTGDARADHALSRSQLFQAILRLLEDLAGRTPTVLVLEDGACALHRRAGRRAARAADRPAASRQGAGPRRLSDAGQRVPRGGAGRCRTRSS